MPRNRKQLFHRTSSSSASESPIERNVVAIGCSLPRASFHVLPQNHWARVRISGKPPPAWLKEIFRTGFLGLPGFLRPGARLRRAGIPDISYSSPWRAGMILEAFFLAEEKRSMRTRIFQDL